MENLNEGKKKKGGMAYEAALREIDAQSAVVALEAKIEKLKEMAETKTNRLNMVSEDENLSELIDKKAMNEMRKEIKQIEKMQEKLEKLYEKKNGKKPEAKEIVDEEEKVDETYSASTYEEDDSVSEGGYDSNYEEDDSVNEEFLRMQKLAGIVTLNETMNVKSANDMQDEMVKSFGRDNLMGAAKLEIVGAGKNEVKDAVELGKMTLQNMLSAIFKKYGPNFSSVAEKGKLSITPQSKEGGALSYSFVITQ